MTDDELVELASDQKKDDNILLVAVLPSYNGFGVEDEAGTISYLQFFIVEKTDYSFLKNRDEYLTVFQRTIEVAKKFILLMFGIELMNCSKEQLQYDFKVLPVKMPGTRDGTERPREPLLQLRVVPGHGTCRIGRRP